MPRRWPPCTGSRVRSPTSRCVTHDLHRGRRRLVPSRADAGTPQALHDLAWFCLLFTVVGILLVFFKDGVFAYQGVIAYLIPLVAFGAWVLALSWGCRRAALAEPVPAA